MLLMSADAGGRSTPDDDVQAAADTDPIAQGLAALDKRLAIELKVLYSTPVFFNLFAVAEPLQAVKSLAEPHAVTLSLCDLNLINNCILAYTAC